MNQCPVCLDEFCDSDLVSNYECSHSCCKSCSDCMFSVKNNVCPICRSSCTILLALPFECINHGVVKILRAFPLVQNYPSDIVIGKYMAYVVALRTLTGSADKIIIVGFYDSIYKASCERVLKQQELIGNSVYHDVDFFRSLPDLPYGFPPPPRD